MWEDTDTKACYEKVCVIFNMRGEQETQPSITLLSYKPELFRPIRVHQNSQAIEKVSLIFAHISKANYIHFVFRILKTLCYNFLAHKVTYFFVARMES
jgi:hypothetical protein